MLSIVLWGISLAHQILLVMLKPTAPTPATTPSNTHSTSVKTQDNVSLSAGIDSEPAQNRVTEASAGQYLRSGGFGKDANQVDINSAYLHGSKKKVDPRSKSRGGRRGSGAIKNRSGSMTKSDPRGAQLAITAEGEGANADPRAQTRGVSPEQGTLGGRSGPAFNADPRAQTRGPQPEQGTLGGRSGPALNADPRAQTRGPQPDQGVPSRRGWSAPYAPSNKLSSGAPANNDPRAQTRGPQPDQGAPSRRGWSAPFAPSTNHSSGGPALNVLTNKRAEGGLAFGGHLAQDPFPGAAAWERATPQDAREGRKAPGVQFLDDLKTSGFRR